MVLVRKMWLFRRYKKFRPNCQIWFQNVRLDLIKKTNTHTWWFHSQTAELYPGSYRHFNATKYVFLCRYCNRTSDRFNPYAHQCSACDSRNYRRMIVRIFPLRPMEVLHGKFMWGIIITYTLGSIYTQKYSSYYILMFLKEQSRTFLSITVISTRHVYTYKCGGEPATYREVI